MKFAGIEASFFLPLFFLLICSSRGATAEEVRTDQSHRQFEEIKTRLAAIESQQQSLLAQKDKILEEIDQIRIWVRHNGGGPKK